MAYDNGHWKALKDTGFTQQRSGVMARPPRLETPSGLHVGSEERSRVVKFMTPLWVYGVVGK
jgi:hypothetical protein